MNRVAVYGTLRQGESNHRLLEKSHVLWVGRVRGWELRTNGYYPYAIPSDEEIVVEVYDVDDKTFDRLDMLEGYPHHYNRITIETPVGFAWIYTPANVGRVPEKKVEGGDWNDQR